MGLFFDESRLRKEATGFGVPLGLPIELRPVAWPTGGEDWAPGDFRLPQPLVLWARCSPGSQGWQGDRHRQTEGERRGLQASLPTDPQPLKVRAKRLDSLQPPSGGRSPGTPLSSRLPPQTLLCRQAGASMGSHPARGHCLHPTSLAQDAGGFSALHVPLDRLAHEGPVP